MQETWERSHTNKKKRDGISKEKTDFELNRQSWRLRNDIWQLQTWYIMLVTDGMRNQKSVQKGNKKLPWVRSVNGSTFPLRGDDIHVNDVWWRFSCIDWRLVIAMSYGRSINQLIKEQYDLRFTPQTEREQVKTKDIYLVAMLGLRIKMDCSIPINSIPRCSAIAEGWQVEEKQQETKDQIKRVAPSNI